MLLAGDDDGLHRGGNGGVLLVADELHGAGLLADPRERGGIGRRLELRRRLRLGAGIGHHRLEAGAIELHPFVLCHFLNQVERRAVGVIKPENLFAAKDVLATSTNPIHRFTHAIGGYFECSRELSLL